MFSLALLATLAIVPSARAVEHRWDTQDGLPQSSVTAVAQGSDGLLQVGTFGGLARFEDVYKRQLLLIVATRRRQ